MNFITLNQLKLDGDEAKKIKLGRTSFRKEHIIGFWEPIDKYDVPIKDAISLQMSSGHVFLVEASMDSLLQELNDI